MGNVSACVIPEVAFVPSISKSTGSNKLLENQCVRIAWHHLSLSVLDLSSSKLFTCGGSCQHLQLIAGTYQHVHQKLSLSLPESP